jgi:hypothetical protein
MDFTSASTMRIEFAAAFLPQASLRLLHAYRNDFQGYLRTLFSGCARAEEGAESHDPQTKQASSWFVETSRVGARRPIVMSENGDVLVLVRKELARQKTDLLISGADVRSGMGHAPTGCAAEAIVRSSPCDVLLFGAMPRPF